MSKYRTQHKLNKRLMDLHNWLADNVQIFNKAKTVTLSDFKLEALGFQGTFIISIDDVPIDSRFKFVLGENGLPRLNYPMFHSPQGAPASFAAVEFSEHISAAIEGLLKEVLPRMKALGYHRETDEYIFSSSQDTNRIFSLEEFETKMSVLITPGYFIKAIVHS